MYVYDNLGSPLALITQNNTISDAWEYDPYGVADLTEQSVTQAYTPFMYTGGLNDRVTGWTLNGARYDDAGEGRWTQMDTLHAPLDPSNANRYAYAANNPVNYTDPTGRASGADFVGAVAGGLLAAVIVAPFAAAGAAAAGSLALAAGVVVGARLVSGCVGGMFGEGVASKLKGQRASKTSLGWSCASGAVTAGFGG